MKQTAVEWLVQEANLLENNGWILPLVEQAKEIESETWCAFDDVELTAELSEIGSDLY